MELMILRAMQHGARVLVVTHERFLYIIQVRDRFCNEIVSVEIIKENLSLAPVRKLCRANPHIVKHYSHKFRILFLFSPKTRHYSRCRTNWYFKLNDSGFNILADLCRVFQREWQPSFLYF